MDQLVVYTVAVQKQKKLLTYREIRPWHWCNDFGNWKCRSKLSKLFHSPALRLNLLAQWDIFVACPLISTTLTRQIDQFESKELTEFTLTVLQRSYMKVMFSLVSVCHSVHRGVPMWPLPMMHWTSLYRAPFPPGPNSGPWTSDLGPLALVPLLVIFGGHQWRPIQNCWFEDTPGNNIWWWLLQAGSMHPTSMLSCSIFYVNDILCNSSLASVGCLTLHL